MRLHVLTGDCRLLLPGILEGHAVAALVEDGARLATAAWLDVDLTAAYHDPLRAFREGPALRVFARSLRDNFGTRHEPLMVLPGLMAAEKDGVPDDTDARDLLSPLDLICEIWKHGPAERIALHAAALPAKADPERAWAAGTGLLVEEARGRLEMLRNACVAGGVAGDRIDLNVIELHPRQTAYAGAWRNAVTCRIAEALRPGLEAEGFDVDQKRFARAIFATLETWEITGLRPAFGMRGQDIERLAARIRGNLSGTARASA